MVWNNSLRNYKLLVRHSLCLIQKGKYSLNKEVRFIVKVSYNSLKSFLEMYGLIRQGRTFLGHLEASVKSLRPHTICVFVHFSCSYQKTRPSDSIAITNQTFLDITQD